MSDMAEQIIEETVRRCRELPEYAGRPAWEQVIRDVIQKHLVAMLAMERERCLEAVRRAPALDENGYIAEKGAVMNEIMRGEG